MNRINLLKKTVRKKPVVAAPSLPSINIPRWVLVVLALAIAIPGILTVALKFMPKKPVVHHVEAPVEKSPFKPSTYASKASIVEEVVREVSAERSDSSRQRSLDIPYNELSFLEKVNYEVLFAKNVLSMFNNAVPTGIGLKSLEIDNFQTLYAVGLGTTRELISATFIALKSEKVELLPQPFSYITSNDGDGYRFVVTCKINTGLDLADPFQASDYLPSRDDLPIITKKIMQLGEKDSVFFTGTPLQTDAEKVGMYRRFHYTYTGSTTYQHFVKYLVHLHAEKIPCAFKKIELKARSGATVDINASVLFTVKE